MLCNNAMYYVIMLCFLYLRFVIIEPLPSNRLHVGWLVGWQFRPPIALRTDLSHITTEFWKILVLRMAH